MRRRNHSKAGLFLIELMISVLFFSITAAIFLQVFVKSNEIRKKSKELFEAQLRVSSAAEMLKQGTEPEQLYYAKDWSPCEEEEAEYVLMIRNQEENNLRRNTILMCTKEQEVIYQVEMDQWLGDQ